MSKIVAIEQKPVDDIVSAFDRLRSQLGSVQKTEAVDRAMRELEEAIDRLDAQFDDVPGDRGSRGINHATRTLSLKAWRNMSLSEKAKFRNYKVISPKV